MSAHGWLKFVLHDLCATCVGAKRAQVARALLRASDALPRAQAHTVHRELSYDWLGVEPITSVAKLRLALIDIADYLDLNAERQAHREVLAALRLLEEEHIVQHALVTKQLHTISKKHAIE